MGTPKLIFKDGEGKYSITGTVFMITPSEVHLIIKDLLEYCNKYTDEDIIKKNKEIEKGLYKITSFNKNEKHNNKIGHVYIFKCADKYKIGFTKDVERRFLQLDTRPFKLSKVFVSEQCVNAYEIEQAIHIKFKEFNIEGEWYSDNLPVEDVIKYIKVSEGY